MKPNNQTCPHRSDFTCEIPLRNFVFFSAPCFVVFPYSICLCAVLVVLAFEIYKNVIKLFK